jgi:hypothetical protein
MEIHEAIIYQNQQGLHVLMSFASHEVVSRRLAFRLVRIVYPGRMMHQVHVRE